MIFFFFFDKNKIYLLLRIDHLKYYYIELIFLRYKYMKVNQINLKSDSVNDQSEASLTDDENFESSRALNPGKKTDRKSLKR